MLQYITVAVSLRFQHAPVSSVICFHWRSMQGGLTIRWLLVLRDPGLPHNDSVRSTAAMLSPVMLSEQHIHTQTQMNVSAMMPLAGYQDLCFLYKSQRNKYTYISVTVIILVNIQQHKSWHSWLYCAWFIYTCCSQEKKIVSVILHLNVLCIWLMQPAS